MTLLRWVTSTLCATALLLSVSGATALADEGTSTIGQDGVLAAADLSVTKVDTPDPVAAGTHLVYTIQVSNEGPDVAVTTSVSDPLPPNTTFVSLSSPAGWSCSTPAVGAGGTVTCSLASFAPETASFTLTVAVAVTTPAGSLLQNTVTVTSSTPDPNPGAESATTFTTVGTGLPAALQLTLTDAPDPVTTGQNLAYTIAIDSSLLDTLDPLLTFPLPAEVGFVSLAAPAGWSCATPMVGATGTISCSASTLAAGTTSFLATAQVATSVGAGATVNATASIVVESSGRPVVATDGEATTALAPVLLSATKVVSGDLFPGGYLTYSLVIANAGPGTLQDLAGNELVDVLPASLLLISASASSGTATAVTTTNTLTWNGTLAAGASVTVTALAWVNAPVGTLVSNQATIAWDADGEGTSNETTGVSDDPATGPAGDPTDFLVAARISVLEIPTLDRYGLGLLVLLLAVAAMWALRRATA